MVVAEAAVVEAAVVGVPDSLPEEHAASVRTSETASAREIPTGSRCSRSPLCQIHVVASERSQEYYDAIKQKFAEERDLRLKYRPEGTAQYTSDLTGDLAQYEIDPYVDEVDRREPINDTVECCSSVAASRRC